MVIGFAVLRANDRSILHAQSWLIADKAAQIQILSQPYAKNPTNFANEKEKRAYQIGEALFRTPIILGGQASKARLSCNSCHVNGGDNEYFLFPNISGAAGTADVSNSFFSSFRGNQNFDPVSIPDLRKKGKIPLDDEQKLRIFVRDLIVEEFNGNEPSKKVLDSLIIYLQKIAKNDDAGKLLSGDKVNHLSVHDPLKLIEQTVENIHYNIKNDDHDTAILLIAAIRHQMGLIYERYQHPSLKEIQNKIRNSSNDLALISNLLRDKNSDYNSQLIQMRGWEKKFQSLRGHLIVKENKSLYSIKKLRASFKV